MSAPTWAEIGGVVLFFVTISGALWGIWWRVEGKVEKAKADALKRAGEAHGKAEQAREELSEYKTHVAETFATKQSMAEGFTSMTKTMTDGFDRMDKRLDGMTDRLDRVIEASHKPVRRQSQ